MKRPELFRMEPIGCYRRRGASPASKARRLGDGVSTTTPDSIGHKEPAWQFLATECDSFHCPPDCPILRAGNCPDSD